MNEKLPPEVRVKVAEHVDGRPYKLLMDREFPRIVSPNCELLGEHGGLRWPMDEDCYTWSPETRLEQKDALTRTAAWLGQEAKEPAYSMAKTKLMEALADNDTDALERLVAELKGFV